MVEYMRDFPQDDPNFTKNLLIGKFLNEHISDFLRDQDSIKLGRVMYCLFPYWKDHLIRLGSLNEIDVEKVTCLIRLTLRDVANVSAEHSEYFSRKATQTIPNSPEEEKIREQANLWPKITEIAKAAAKLEVEKRAKQPNRKEFLHTKV